MFSDEDFIVITSNKKGINLSIELQNSDDEVEEWLQESVEEKMRKFQRISWMHPMNILRPKDGEYVRICVPLRKYADKFFKYFRMSVSTFDYILGVITESVTKTSKRPSISPAERLAVTLRYTLLRLPSNCSSLTSQSLVYVLF